MSQVFCTIRSEHIRRKTSRFSTTPVACCNNRWVSCTMPLTCCVGSSWNNLSCKAPSMKYIICSCTNAIGGCTCVLSTTGRSAMSK